MDNQIELLPIPENTPDDIKIWLEALRSGEYDQCLGMLQEEGTNNFCCLGVYAKVNKVFSNEEMATNDPDDDMNYNQELYDNIKYEIGKDVADELIDLNDSGNSFKFISNYIVENMNSFLENKSHIKSMENDT